MSGNLPSARLATRLAFVVAGFSIAAWAATVPYAKARVGVDEAGLGILLLCLGGGSILMMPATGGLCARFGSRKIILAGGIGVTLFLPMLALADTPALLGLLLAAFGASLGALEVAMNIHASEVQSDSPHPLMSGFHAMFSVGGFIGAGGMALLLSFGLQPVKALMIGSLGMALALFIASPRLLASRQGEPVRFVLPRGSILLFAFLAWIAFLMEGSLLDWSALLIVQKGLVPVEQGGAGYMVFAVAMTLARLTGDRIVAAAGPRRVLIAGGSVVVLGVALLAAAPALWVAMVGLVLLGLGAANIVPVLVSLSAQEGTMAPGLAIAAVTTAGYAGVLLGPALLGGLAHHSSLPVAFAILAAIMVAIPVAALVAIRSSR